ncbi:MAG: dehydratase [Clostridiales bacterium]|nr:dehydratase [Clostridiales bacterium]
MEHYRMEELEIGMEKEFSVPLTEEKMKMFTQISGDVNPLHLDDDFAQMHGFPSRVVYGMLTASFYSTLAGVYLPGERCLLHEVDAKFVKPVILADKEVLTVWGRIEEVNRELGFIRLKARVWNQKGEIVSRARIMAGVL